MTAGRSPCEEKHHHLWRDADHLANPRSRSAILDYASLREIFIDCLGNYQCQSLRESLRNGQMILEEYEHMMKMAGYNQRQILDYWDDVLFEPAYCDRQCRLAGSLHRQRFHAGVQDRRRSDKPKPDRQGLCRHQLGLSS